jgi:tetratricopeptide (TPR) repeat protein
LGKQRRAKQIQKEARAAAPRARTLPLAPIEISESTLRILLSAILSLAVILRLVYLLQYRAKSVFYAHLMLDAQVYEDWARRIAAGEWLGGSVFYHAPLYPYLIALFFKALGHRYLPIYLLQMMMGIATLALIYRIGRRCASGWIGLCACALLVLYAPLPFFETKILATSLSLLLSTLALAVLVEAWEKGGWLLWGTGGALVGLAALASPMALLLAPVFGAGALLRTRRFHEAAALALGTMIAVAPATLHNLAAGGGPVLISSQGGITFYQGNMPSSRGLYQVVEGFSGSALTQMQEEREMAEKAVGHPLRASEVSSYWFHKGLDLIAAQPGEAFALLQLKLLRWFSSIEYSTEYSQSIERSEVASLWIPILPFGFLAVGAIVGIAVGARSYPRLVPVYLYLGATLAPPLIFYVSSRYRLPVVPALAILCAGAAEWVVRCARARRLLDALPVLLLVLILSSFTLIPYRQDHLFQDANVHYNTGNLFYEEGDYDTAIREYQQALQVSDFEYYRVNLGNAFTRKGRFDEAVEQYRLVTIKKPGFAKAYVQWAKALALQGKVAEARAIYQKAVQLKTRNAEVEAMLNRAPTP